MSILICIILLISGIAVLYYWHCKDKEKAAFYSECGGKTTEELKAEFEKLVELSYQNPKKKSGDWLWKADFIASLLDIRSLGKKNKSDYEIDLSRLNGYEKYRESKEFEREFMQRNTRMVPINNSSQKVGQGASVVKSAIVGGVIAGPAGAVVGAVAAADKNNRAKK